jgi:ribonuclease VapC
MMPGFLFDSHALLAFFQGEKGAEAVMEFLKKTNNNGIEPLICVINLGEILYLTKRRFGDAKKIEILGRIHQLSFNIIPATNDLPPMILFSKPQKLRPTTQFHMPTALQSPVQENSPQRLLPVTLTLKRLSI